MPPKEAPPQPPREPPPSGLQSLGEEAEDYDSGNLAPEDVEAAAVRVERSLKRGRLNITLLEARNVRKKGGGKKFSADAYVKLVLGINPLTQMETKSKTLKKSASPIVFHEEVVAFDVTDPRGLLATGDIPLKIEVFDENLLSDELLGQVTLSALRFLDGQVHRETLPLSLPASGERDAGELDVEIKLDVAFVGMLSIVLVEGRNLKSMELIGKQDPYCKLSIGAFSKRSKTINKGGRNPYFGEEEVVFWITEDLWTHRMQLALFDEDIGSDDLIGDATFSVLHFMEKLGSQEHVIALKNSGHNAGEVVVKVEFFPAGDLTVRCVAARQLRSVDAIGRQDPYVKLTLEGRATKSVMKTKTDTDGGREPEWEDAPFAFQVVDQYNMLVEVWDEDLVGDDDLIGSANISLLPIFRYGYVDDWLNLWNKGKFGAKEPAGQLHLEMTFEAPAGVAYPQHQIGMDRFAEKERRTKETAGSGPIGDNKESETAATLAALTAASAKASAVSAATRASSKPTEMCVLL